MYFPHRGCVPCMSTPLGSGHCTVNAVFYQAIYLLRYGHLMLL